MLAGSHGMPAKFCRKNGFTGSRLPVRHSAKFEGWAAEPPILQAVYESQVCVVKHTDLVEPETGMLCTSLKLRQKILPEYVPELITVVLAEKFAGIHAEMAIGRRPKAIDEDTAYLNWTKINDVGRWHQEPSSTFLPPGENGVIHLSLRVRGDTPPNSGLLYYFLKARKWHN